MGAELDLGVCIIVIAILATVFLSGWMAGSAHGAKLLGVPWTGGVE